MTGELRFRPVGVPRLARVAPRALRELADDCLLLGVERAAVVFSRGLPDGIVSRVRRVLSAARMCTAAEAEVTDGSLAERDAIAGAWASAGPDGVIAVGGGRALDVGKAVAATLRAAGREGAEPGVPVVCVPTSLSHDGFASPSSSLVNAAGERVTVRSPGPAGVVVDTAVVAAAPWSLTLAGVGDVMAKVTALADWQLAEHAGEGERVDGVAASIAESAVVLLERAELRPETWSAATAESLARALLLGGVAMAVAGSSRPCSGSEHLLSHALDRLRRPPGSHGIQVGLAAYLVSHLHDEHLPRRLATVYDRCGFWTGVCDEAKRGLSAALLLEAARLAPSVRPGYRTVLNRPGAIERLGEVVASVWGRIVP
ncbi:MAG: iron-containing alcohol dehydrogenase [Tepidisphaerales bacterium]